MNAAGEPMDALPNYLERLRAEFEPQTAALDEGQRVQLEQEAVALLTSLLAIEEHPSPIRPSDEDKDAVVDIARLERKLDLVLELLSLRLLDGHAPPERSVQLSAAGVRWAQPGALPAPGTQGVATLYVHRLLPRALRLAAEVVADEPGWLRLRFVGMAEACEDLLVRHVFQQHRRSLAGSKRAARSA